jgi:histidinol-phosphate aminotransferase
MNASDKSGQDARIAAVENIDYVATRKAVAVGPGHRTGGAGRASAASASVASRFWSPLVHSLSPYVPGEQISDGQLVKLNTNENPYPPSFAVIKAISQVIGGDGAGLRLYPDPTSLAVRQAAAKLHELSVEQVFVGNGSDEVLAFVFQTLLNQPTKGPVYFPDISYSFYPSYCRLYGVAHKTLPLNDAFEIPLDALDEDTPAVIFPNPNAPTGKALSRAQIESFLQSHPETMLVVDEAYVDFGAQSCIPLVQRYPNLLVTQSLSKSRALAGVRVGLAFGHRDLIEALVRAKDSFNSYPVDRLAQAAAKAALEDEVWLSQTVEKITASRDWLTSSLQQLGFQVLPSKANFVFARYMQASGKPREDRSGAFLCQTLKDNGVLVRQFNRPRIEDFLRITVGSSSEVLAVVEALDRILKA